MVGKKARFGRNSAVVLRRSASPPMRVQSVATTKMCQAMARSTRPMTRVARVTAHDDPPLPQRILPDRQRVMQAVCSDSFIDVKRIAKPDQAAGATW